MLLPHDLRPLFDHVLLEEMHQQTQLAPRPLPVLAAEAIQRQLLDPQAAAFLDEQAHALDTAPVPLDAGESAGLRPAAVAVHDDGDMPRQSIGAQALGGKLIGRVGG